MTYHTVDADKVLGAFRPRRQHYVAKRLSIVVGPETVAVAVGEHVRQIEELGN